MPIAPGISVTQNWHCEVEGRGSGVQIAPFDFAAGGSLWSEARHVPAASLRVLCQMLISEMYGNQPRRLKYRANQP
jgi:hypothetical protein